MPGGSCLIFSCRLFVGLLVRHLYGFYALPLCFREVTNSSFIGSCFRLPLETYLGSDLLIPPCFLHTLPFELASAFFYVAIL